MAFRALILSSVAVCGLAAGAQAATETFVYTGAIQTWTAPSDGDYRVVAIGAQGASAQPGFIGGRGAQIEGTFSFSAGDMFQILVGGMGLGEDSGSNGGGGGGSFFVTIGDTPLLIAGGGGGTRVNAGQNGTDASITEAAYTASGGAPSYVPTLKAVGIGQGGIRSSSSWGSAGGGFFSDGQTDNPGNWGSGGGLSWANGMLGGSSQGGSCNFQADGGFGGGGTGNGCWGGGGGGGYSGGDGGFIAGGGGSFNAGADQIAVAGVGFGEGLMTISYDMAVVPLPATLPLFGAALAGLGLLRRRG